MREASVSLQYEFMKKIVLILSFLFAFSTFAFPQQKGVCENTKDYRLDKNNPTVYLTFERFGKAKGDWKQSKLGEDKWSNNLAPLHRSFFWGYRLEEEK